MANPERRAGFDEIVSGWMLISGTEDLDDRLERLAKWMEQNSPLLPAEQATVEMMIRSQIARHEDNGSFWWGEDGE